MALEDAVEDGYIEHNHARGKRMRVHVPKPKRTFLEIDELAALIDAATEQDVSLGRLASPIELCDMKIGHVRVHDPNGARLRIPDSKTEAGVREVQMSPDLAETVVEHIDRLRRMGGQLCGELSARSDELPDGQVRADRHRFGTTNGTKTALKAPRSRSKRIRERPKTRMDAGDPAMELARLELATSWVRSRRSPN